MYRAVKITRGGNGWGGPLIVKADDKKNKILSVTGGGIHPVAAKLAEMTGCTAVGSFKGGAPDDEVLVAVVDCGGTARCGVYPKKHIMTVNLMPVGKSGPLANFIVEDIYVSDVTENSFSYADESEAASAAPAAPQSESSRANEPKSKDQAKQEIAAMREQKEPGIITKIGIGVGKVVNKCFAAGRESIDMVIRNVLPFMAFTATILGIIQVSGLGNIIANTIAPLCAHCRSFPPFSTMARLLHRLSELCSARRLAWAAFHRSMHFLHCLRLTHNAARISYLLACPLGSPNRKPLNWASRLSFIPVLSPALWQSLLPLHSARACIHR